jgi:hypothetical protein
MRLFTLSVHESANLCARFVPKCGKIKIWDNIKISIL